MSEDRGRATEIDAELAAKPWTARPIFDGAPAEEIDETWTQGAYVGGMVAANEDAGIAESYLAAADELVEHGVRDDALHEFVLPALFLYRHALELRLKFAVRPTKPNHDLAALARELDRLLRAKGSEGLPPNAVARIEEIGTRDPRADAFRFTEKLVKGKAAGMHLPEEVWVDVAYLKRVMHWLDDGLRAAAEMLRT